MKTNDERFHFFKQNKIKMNYEIHHKPPGTTPDLLQSADC
jgi:hypothetical protein